MKLGEFLSQLTADDRNVREASEARDRALETFADACRRLDEDPRERQRINDSADLIDAEDALYQEALAALDRGDHARALPLLQRTAEAGIGESTWLLAGLLERLGQTAEAITWYQQAAADGDLRADAKFAELSSPRTLISWLLRSENSEAHPGVQPRASDYTQLEAASVIQVASAHNLNRAFPWLATRHLDISWATRTLEIESAAADSLRLLAVPHHGRCDSWPPRLLLLVEGRTEECMVRRLLSAYRAAGPIATSWIPSPAGGGLDFICSADRQLLNQVKTVKYLHRQLRNYHRAYGSAIATPLTSWQIETEPTASDIMTPLTSLTTLAPGTTVHHAIGQMLQSGADALLVCDEGHQVQGMVTLPDLARCIHDSRGALTIERIETVMQSPVAVELTASLSEVRCLIVHSGPTLIAVNSPTGTTVGGITFQEVLAHEQSSRDTYRTERTQNSRHALLLPPTEVCAPV